MFDKAKRTPYIAIMKKPEPTKDAIIGIRTTEAVKAAVEKAALAERRSMSQWIEGLIIDALAKVPRKSRRRTP